MANEIFKNINTRIALRTGDFAYWTTGAGKDIELIKGEVCVCTVAAADNQATTAPTVLLKICDTTGKKFADLRWTSALAADVHGWAKVTEAEHKEWLKTNHADLDTRYNFSVEGDKLVVTKDLFVNGEKSGDTVEVGKYEFLSETEVRTILADYYTKEEVNGLIAGVVGDEDKDTKDSNTIIGAKKYVDDAIEGIISGSGYATQNWVTGEIEKLDKADTAVDGQYVKSVSQSNGVITVERGNLPTSADYGVLEVKGDEDSGVVVDNTDAQRPIVKIAANTYDAHGAASEAEGRINETLKSYYTKTEADAAFTTPAEVISEVNKALSEVSNADTIENISTLVNYVNENAADLTGLITEVYGAAEMTGDSRLDLAEGRLDALEDGVDGWNGELGAKALAQGVKDVVDTNKATWDKAGTALQAADLTEYDEGKNFGDIITHNTSEFASSTENGAKELAQGVKNVVDANKATWDKAGTALQASDLTAYDASKNFGDIITHNVAEFATKAQGEKADSALQEITTTANNGLKVTNKNNIDIDTDVVFVLDCNW